MHAELSHIKLTLNYAEICITSADFTIHDPEFYARSYGVCADICARCIQDYDCIGDDAQVKACADICPRCPESCWQATAIAQVTVLKNVVNKRELSYGTVKQA